VTGLRAIGRALLYVLVVCVMLPVHFVAVLYFALRLAVRHRAVHRRLRDRYWALARRPGLDRGTVVASSFTGGEMATPQLRIVALWAAAPEEVVATVTRGVCAAGYGEPTWHVSPGPGRRLTFESPAGQGQPDLVMLLYGPGDAIEATNIVVPAAMTGVRFGL
jgi:hypothetical protein